MAGDTANAEIWANADVYIGVSGATGPADVTTAWSAVDFDVVGLLSGDDGFTESRKDDTNEFYAWGGILVKRTKSKHKRSIKFVAMEDNPVVFALVNPGSTRSTVSGLTTSVVKVPTSAEFAIGFETTDGVKTKRRYCKRATVDTVADIKEGESDLTLYEVTVILYPESDGTIYTDLEGAA